jgi:hypothetical protein
MSGTWKILEDVLDLYHQRLCLGGIEPQIAIANLGSVTNHDYATLGNNDALFYGHCCYPLRVFVMLNGIAMSAIPS